VVINNKYVYILYHSYENELDDYEEKVLGIYSSEDNGNTAILMYKELEGFVNYQNGFFLSKTKLNENFAWTEGFTHQSWHEMEGIPFLIDTKHSSVEQQLEKIYQTIYYPRGPGSEYQKLKEMVENYV